MKFIPSKNNQVYSNDLHFLVYTSNFSVTLMFLYRCNPEYSPPCECTICTQCSKTTDDISHHWGWHADPCYVSSSSTGRSQKSSRSGLCDHACLWSGSYTYIYISQRLVISKHEISINYLHWLATQASESMPVSGVAAKLISTLAKSL